MASIGELIGGDLAMSAKVLQLVNSSFFGLAQHVSCPTHAASLLGINVIRPLVLLAGAYSQCEDPNIQGYDLEQSVVHSIEIAKLARAIAKSETEQNHVIDDTFVAGMMIEIGKLILAVNIPKEYEQILREASELNVPSWKREKEVLGVTHAQVGAHLLGLWGFPNSIVEAVAFHHQPSDSSGTGFSPLAAVHAANALWGSRQPWAQGIEDSLWDEAYLTHAGLSGRKQDWIEVGRAFG
jgi:HD-like signal output (HDOD) protein